MSTPCLPPVLPSTKDLKTRRTSAFLKYQGNVLPFRHWFIREKVDPTRPTRDFLGTNGSRMCRFPTVLWTLVSTVLYTTSKGSREVSTSTLTFFSGDTGSQVLPTNVYSGTQDDMFTSDHGHSREDLDHTSVRPGSFLDLTVKGFVVYMSSSRVPKYIQPYPYLYYGFP